MMLLERMDRKALDEALVAEPVKVTQASAEQTELRRVLGVA